MRQMNKAMEAKWMSNKKGRFVSDWRPVSELRRVEQDISDWGYQKKYIRASKLDEKKYYCWGCEGKEMCLIEPLEVDMQENTVYYRENETRFNRDIPEVFDTQFGRFNNYNNGEFDSWLGKPCNERISKNELFFGFLNRSDYFIEGNYCDMFDCGDYCYAVSNLMHMALGLFKVVRIGSGLDAVTVYDRVREEGETSFEYEGRFKNEKGFILVVSGSTYSSQTRQRRDRTLLIQIDTEGSCSVIREWNFKISHANSLVEDNGFIYFGQNKLITRLNEKTGELSFFTNKNDEELNAIVIRP